MWLSQVVVSQVTTVHLCSASLLSASGGFVVPHSASGCFVVPHSASQCFTWFCSASYLREWCQSASHLPNATLPITRRSTLAIGLVWIHHHHNCGTVLLTTYSHFPNNLTKQKQVIIHNHQWFQFNHHYQYC